MEHNLSSFIEIAIIAQFTELNSNSLLDDSSKVLTMRSTVIPIDPLQFKKIIKEKVPVGIILPNPWDGDTTIISITDSKICYRRGKSKIYVDLNHLYDAFNKFYRKKVSSIDLRSFNSAVFDSYQNGHSWNCTFFFLILKEIGAVKTIEGEGKRGNPFYVALTE